LVQKLELAIDDVLTLDQPALIPLDLFSPTPNFILEIFTKLDKLFFSGNNCALSEIFGFALGFTDNALCHFVRGRFRCNLPIMLEAYTALSSYNEKRRAGGHQNYAKHGDDDIRVHMDLCSTAARGRRTGRTTTAHRRASSEPANRRHAGEGRDVGPLTAKRA
jgi:hypothetical protein